MKYSEKNIIGLIGFGTVGKGFYEIFKQSNLPALGFDICVFDIDTNKTINLPINEVVSSETALFDRNPSILVELIDNSDESLRLAEKAVLWDVPFITANKKMIAQNIEYVSEWLRSGKILYEASVAGSIPIIKTIRDYYNDQQITSIRGILNGSSNYILTNLFEKDITFENALKEAQNKGFAETDPTLDISGQDIYYKSVILASTAFGRIPDKESILIKGISEDILNEYQNSDRKVKLVANINKNEDNLSIEIQPQFIDPDDILSAIDYEYNCIEIKNESFDTQVLIGKGAGSLPTGSAVFSDLQYAIGKLDTEKTYRKYLSIH